MPRHRQIRRAWNPAPCGKSAVERDGEVDKQALTPPKTQLRLSYEGYLPD